MVQFPLQPCVGYDKCFETQELQLAGRHFRCTNVREFGAMGSPRDNAGR